MKRAFIKIINMMLCSLMFVTSFALHREAKAEESDTFEFQYSEDLILEVQGAILHDGETIILKEAPIPEGMDASCGLIFELQYNGEAEDYIPSQIDGINIILKGNMVFDSSIIKIMNDKGEEITFEQNEKGIVFSMSGFHPFFIQVIQAEQDNILAQEEPQTENQTNEGSQMRGEGVTSIDSFVLQFVSGASLKDDKLVWDATRNTSGHSFAFRVAYSTSGIGNTAAGGYEIRIPKHIIKDREGNYADEIELSIIHETEYEPGEDIDFVYREDTGAFVVYNVRPLSSAQNGYFEFSYSLTKTMVNYPDMGENDPVSAQMDVNGHHAETNEIKVYNNTTANILSTDKRYPTLYKEWQSVWGETPADAEDYYYLVWEFYTKIEEDITQPYDLQFTDTVSSDDGTVEVVGFKYSGQSGFTSNNTVSDQRQSQYRYDYVLTRHAKADFMSFDKYSILNRIKIDLIPADRIDPITTVTSQRRFSWERPEFHYPTGRFEQFKRADASYRANYSIGMRNSLDLKRGNYTRYDLDKLKDAKVTSLDNFDYGTWIYGYAYPWTVDENDDPLDPESYGKVPVTYELRDEGVFLSEDGGTDSTRELTSQDFEFYRINYAFYSDDAILDNDTLTFKRSDVSYGDDETATFYLKFTNTSSQYVEAATYHLKNATWEFNQQYISEMDGRSIIPKENCIAYKIVYSNAHYFTEIDSVPYLKLKNSSYVMSTIRPFNSIAIRNRSYGLVTDSKGNTLYSHEESDKDFARVTQRDSYISKDVVSSANNKKKKVYILTWKANAKEQMTIGEGTKEYIEQESGTFYDLLPKGMSIIEKSIQVQNEDGYLSASSFEYERTINYHNTGREMLIVRVKDPGDYYNLYFDTAIDWDGINDFGNDVYNPIGYRTGNEDIKNGSNDDGGSLKEAELMSSLTTEEDGNRFIYADEYYDIVALTAATAGLTKKVKSLDEETYSYSTMSEPDGFYQYRLRYMPIVGTKAKNLILFDSLENYVIVDEDNDTSDWHGFLNDINVSQPLTMGCAPIIYLSREENLSLPEHHDLSDNNIWIEMSQFGDISEAKAIAVDLSKKADDSDFILNENESVNVVLTMKAPSGASSEKVRIPVTYNNVYSFSTVIDVFENAVDFFVHHDYTAVRLLVRKDIKIYKISSEDSSPIRNIKFRLWGTSDYGTEYDLIEATDKNGDLVFPKIEKGSYILAEYEGTADWIEDHTEHSVLINDYGQVFIDGNDHSSTPLEVTNDPRVHADIVMLKKEKDAQADLQFANDAWNPRTMTKYAVALYGIGQDKDEDGNAMSLTFGPATGASSYMASYIAHSVDEHGKISDTDAGTTKAGNPYRCIHHDSWEQIVYWNVVDPEVYHKCIAKGCTHSVNLTVDNSTVLNGTKYAAVGDGPSTLYNEMPDNYRKWNTSTTNAGGWGESNIRAVLNGVDTDSSDGIATKTTNAAYTLSEEDALIAAFPEILQAAIGRKAVKYDSVYNNKTEANLKTTYDKLWLLSSYEMGDSSSITRNYYQHPLERLDGSPAYYQRFVEIEKLSTSPKPFFKAYRANNSQSGSDVNWWLHSVYGGNAVDVLGVSSGNGGSINNITASGANGVSPCFSLTRNAGDISASLASVSGVGPGASEQGTGEPFWLDLLSMQKAKPSFPTISGLIPNTTFRLYGTSDYGTEINILETSGSNGRIAFKNIEKGTYKLSEIKENQYFIKNETEYTVVIDESGNVTSDMTQENAMFFSVENEPRYWDFSLRKVDAEDKNIWLQGSTITIQGTSDLGTEVNLTLTSDENGKFEIEGLEKGTYILSETAAPTGVDAQGHTGTGGTRNYLLDPIQRYLILDGNGRVKIDGLSLGSTGELFLENERSLDGRITVYKHWVYYDGDELSAPQLTLSSVSPDSIPKYRVTFEANGGHFDDNTSTNSILIQREGALNYLKEGTIKEPVPNEDGLIFNGWYYDRNGVQKWNQKDELTQNTTVYAVWKDTRMRYAVSLYGIGQDIDENGNTMGLTFGPATGGDYVNSFKAHTPSGQTTGGHDHRCIHNDTWEEIIYWNSIDPDVYEECIAEGCTKSVPLNLSSAIKNSDFVVSYTGDGPSLLYYELSQRNNGQDLSYNASQANTGGWGASRTRALLNGPDEHTDSTVAGDAAERYTPGNTLIAAFPDVLQQAIGKKAVRYDSVNNSRTAANLKTTFDKLWLLSSYEMGDSSSILTTEYQHPLEALDETPHYYQRFAENSKLTTLQQDFFRAYRVNATTGTQAGKANIWWLRSVNGSISALIVGESGSLGSATAVFNGIGLAPCFSLSR